MTQILGKGKFIRKQVKREISLSNISFIRDYSNNRNNAWNTLLIVKKAKNGKINYKGDETSIKLGFYSKNRRIRISGFITEEERADRDIFKSTLLNILNANPHPYLSYIYILNN